MATRLHDRLLLRGPIFPSNGFLPPPPLKHSLLTPEARVSQLLQLSASSQLVRDSASIFVSKRRYSCPKCPYSTDRRDLYTRHENIHRDQKPFRCYVCEKMFNRADHVKKHFLRIHKGIDYDVKLTKRVKGRDYDVKEMTVNSNQNQNIIENKSKSLGQTVSQSNCFAANPLLSELLYKRTLTNLHSVINEEQSNSTQQSIEANQIRARNAHFFNNESNSKSTSNLNCEAIRFPINSQTLKVQNNDDNKDEDNQCEYCGACFVDFASLHTHRYLLHRYLLENNNYWPYRCVICGQRSVTQVAMMSHMSNHNTYKSRVCVKSNTSKAPIIKSSSNRRKQLQPRKIVKSFKDIEEYPIEPEVRYSSDNKMIIRSNFNCKICHKDFSTYTQLVQHIKFVKH